MAASGVAWRSVASVRLGRKFLEVLRKIDGEIKAPPAGGVHVVGCTGEFRLALCLGGWHIFHIPTSFQMIGGWRVNFRPRCGSHERRRRGFPGQAGKGRGWGLGFGPQGPHAGSAGSPGGGQGRPCPAPARAGPKRRHRASWAGPERGAQSALPGGRAARRHQSARGASQGHPVPRRAACAAHGLSRA